MCIEMKSHYCLCSFHSRYMLVSFRFALLKLSQNLLFPCSCAASPANSKMAHRMTTLHEEPLRHNPLQEENEDSYSDPEYDYDNKPQATNPNDYYAKSRMRSSHTIDSFMDIDKKTSTTSTNLLNYRLLTQNQTFHVPTQVNKGLAEKPLKNGKLESVIAGTSPSMNSSTSSGYGSQAVSISNLTNEDTLSLQSMSVDESTPGKTMPNQFPPAFSFLLIPTDFQSSSPPRKDPAGNFTPSTAQKRFNPFMKDAMGKNQHESSEPSQTKSDTSPKITKPLTPTKDHPLKDLERSRAPKSEFMDEEEEDDDELVVVLTEDKCNDAGCEAADINSINQIPPETASHQATNVSTIKSDDVANNNSNQQQVEDESRLAPVKTAPRAKSPSRLNNNTTNVKNNNQTKIEESLTKSSDKIEGEMASFDGS
jgi:hypothetical protein